MDVVHCREISEEVQAKIKSLVLDFAVRPCLRIILVGNDPASAVYVSRKSKVAGKLGIDCQIIRLEKACSQEEIALTIDNLNRDEKVDGILLQMPLPAHVDKNRLILTIDPQKDVDGFHPLQEANKLRGEEYFTPCTPLSCLYILKRVMGTLAGAHALVIGRSFIVGAPMAKLLLGEDCTITVAHSKTKNLPKLCAIADILVVAAGIPKLVKGEWLEKDSVVLDVGINRTEDGKIVGDVDFASTSSIQGKITPVPGGVGLMTVSMLAWNTLKACLRRSGRGTLSMSAIL